MAYTRGDGCKSDQKVIHFAKSMGARLATRHQPEVCDISVQWGSSMSPARQDALEKDIPFITLENGVWWDKYKSDTYTVSFNGLHNRGNFPEIQSRESRYHPKVPRGPDTDGVATIIFGQVPTDASLEGLDLEAWVEEKKQQYPEAEYRPHPIMVSSRTFQEPFDEALRRCRTAITYSSTVASQAIIAGKQATVDSSLSLAYPYVSGEMTLERWLHWLSWRHWRVSEDIDYEFMLEGAFKL